MAATRTDRLYVYTRASRTDPWIAESELARPTSADDLGVHLGLNSNGTMLVAARRYNTGGVTVFMRENGLTGNFSFYEDIAMSRVRCVAMSNSGEWIALARDNQIRMFRFSAGTYSETQSLSTSQYNFVTMTDDFLVAGGGSML